MWWMPLIALGQNKMAEKKAEEDFKKQQLHSIRSRMAADFGSPGYGEQLAGDRYRFDQQMDEARRRRNSELMGSVFSSMGSTGSDMGPDDGPDEEAMKAAEEAAARRARAQAYLQRN